MMIKLFVTDIDGTLLPTGGGVVPAENIKVIQEMTTAGIKVVIATGRMYCAALPIAAQLGVPVPIIAYNGALIKSSSGEILHTQYMDAADVLALLKFFKDSGRHIQSYVDDIFYVAEENRWSKFYSESLKAPFEVVGWEGLFARAENVPKLLSITDNPEELVDTMNVVRKNFGDKIEVTRSHPMFAEFLKKGVTKAGAIKILADKFNIANEEILAIGDSENDLPMLMSAGIGVAMGNAADNVKKSCRHITDTCDNGGFVKAVYKYVLKD